MYAKIYSTLCTLQCSEAAVEEDLRYNIMLQPSRIYIGESVNVFQRGMLAFIFIVQHLESSFSDAIAMLTMIQCLCQICIGSLVMEHPGTHPLPTQGKPTIFGGVNGSIGM